MILHSPHLQALLQTLLLKTFNHFFDYLDRNSLQHADLFNAHVATSKAVDFQIYAKVLLPIYVCVCVSVCVCVFVFCTASYDGSEPASNGEGDFQRQDRSELFYPCVHAKPYL